MIETLLPTIAASPVIDVELQVPEELKNLFMSLPRIVECGVAAVGDPANYALVWEWGNIRQTEKGPDTTLGTNPDGEEVWLSIQAPSGWIAVNEPLMWEVILEEIGKIEFEGNDKFHIEIQLENASIKIAERFIQLLQDTVPIRSGDLKGSLEVVEPGDALLNETLEDSQGDVDNRILSLGAEDAGRFFS